MNRLKDGTWKRGCQFKTRSGKRDGMNCNNPFYRKTTYNEKEIKCCRFHYTHVYNHELNQKLKQKCAYLQKRNEVLEKDYDALEKDYDALEKDYDALEKDYEALEKDCDALEKTYQKENKDEIILSLN
jgi:predicted RNase H-like nuclease (RuvC/YqgF family)